MPTLVATMAAPTKTEAITGWPASAMIPQPATNGQITPSVATSVAVLFWLVTFVTIVPFGLAAALHAGLSWRKLRDLEREAAP